MGLDDLITVAELETAIGRTLTGPDSAQAESIITDVSALIRAETGQPFAAQVAVTITMQADSYGIIELHAKPVIEIVSVKDTGTGKPVQGWTFDGVERLCVPAWLAVEITYSVGVAQVPDDIKAVAKAMAARQVINPAGIRQETVGGTSVTYASVFGEAGSIAPSSLERKILNHYRTTEATWRI